MISLSGVHVGNVKSFTFIPEENKLDVALKIDAQYLPRITEGAAVDVRTQGALGDKFIFIIPGDPNAKPLKDGDKIPVAPPTDLLSVISEKSSDLTKFFDILNEIHKFTKTLNAENRADRIFKNLAETSQDLRATAKDAREFMAEVRSQDSKKITSTVDKLDRILTKIDRGDGSLGALINDPSLHDSLKSMLGATDKKKSIKSLIRSSIEKTEKSQP
jgi:phospholipid/cholesterol/gamma-HCH transport system substrate-binding protein